MMGFSYSQNDSPVMCFNAAKSVQSGWFSDKTVTIDPNNDAGSCYSGPLYGLDSYTSSPADANVLIQLLSTGATNYHIGFNGKQGSNVVFTQIVVELVPHVPEWGECISPSPC